MINCRFVCWRLLSHAQLLIKNIGETDTSSIFTEVPYNCHFEISVDKIDFSITARVHFCATYN